MLVSDDPGLASPLALAARLPAGATRVPWLDDAGSDAAPAGLPLEAPFTKWGRASDRPGVYCRFRDPAYPGHTGIDLQVDPGATVASTLAGTVAWAAEDGPYGNLVVVQAGSIQTWYAHLSRIDVEVGQRLRVGQPVGSSGGTPGAPGAGSSGGPHLHYAVRWRAAEVDGDLWLDPGAWLPADATDYLGCSR